MRLDELRFSDARHLIKHKWTMPQEVSEWLTQHHFVEIGYGNFSLVFAQRNSNVVIKVTVKEDRCWRQFVEYCQQHRGNPHLPRISRVITYRSVGGEKLFIAFMERLKRLLPRRHYDFFDWLQVDENSDMASELQLARAQYFEKRHPLLTSTVRDIQKFASRSRCYNDLERRNFMTRGNDTIVISDPIFNDSDTDNWE